MSPPVAAPAARDLENPDVLSSLLRAHRTPVVRYAMRVIISPQDAEDATQETLLALSRHVGGLRDVAALTAWLFKVVRRHCLRLARRSARRISSAT